MFGVLGEVLGKSAIAVAIVGGIFLPFVLTHLYVYTQQKRRHKGTLTAAVMDQARRGKIHFISSHSTKLAKSVAERVASELLGAGCSLIELDLIGVSLNGTWAETLGDAAVCSKALRELWLGKCKLRRSCRWAPQRRRRGLKMEAEIMPRKGILGGSGGGLGGWAPQ